MHIFAIINQYLLLMKKIIVLFVMFFAINSVTYASFPVAEEIPYLVENSVIFTDSNNTSTEVPYGTDWGLFWWCFFVGTLGVHRYMMGDIWQGIVQTLTLGGVYVWWIIDLVRIANGSLSR